MGKSTSCLKLIACGGDAADKDDYDVSQVKGSNDKRGWSFRKRSARHRVLSNTVMSDASSANRENSGWTTEKLESPSDALAEKITTTQSSDGKLNQSSLLNSKTPETLVVTAIDDKGEDGLEESIAVIIQAAIREFLAQKELLKHKNAVKLQAAVRGHLVRRHAVGTLRCVQAIFKMQALVRARQGKKNELTKTNLTYCSIEKILSNTFARHLLDSTQKNTRILIKCDPSRDDSAWKWLERWMSIATADFAENKSTESLAEQHDVKKENICKSQVETEDSDANGPSPESGSTHKEPVSPSEIEEHVITYDANHFTIEPEIQFESSPAKDILHVSLPENMNVANDKEVSTEMKSRQYENAPPDASSQEDDSFLEKPEVETAPPRHYVERFTSDQLETDKKIHVIGSRKSSNPSFIAAQSKFEELSSSVYSGKSMSSHRGTDFEVRAEAVSSEADTAINIKEFHSAEDSVPFASRVEVGGSKCGTEIYVTSTLDSPDISETGAENEDEGKCTAEDAQDLEYGNKLDDDAKDPPNIAVSNSSKSIPDQPEILENANAESIEPAASLASENWELEMEKKESDVDGELNSDTVPQDFRASPEATPRSHVTIPESEGTPSSQVSINPKGSKTGKARNKNKRISLSGGKKSPARAYNDSGSRRSGEEIHKDQRTGKRRNSFGLVKPNHIDQEPRDSSSSSKDHSIPHFMQATESARAKMHANNSPRSSPDMQDRDIYIKKRHSLPSATGRQGSPRIQRSMSQLNRNV